MKHEIKNLKFLRNFIILMFCIEAWFSEASKLEPGTPMISSHNQNLRKKTQMVRKYNNFCNIFFTYVDK